MILCKCCTHLFDHFTGDGVSISVDGTLCYHYDVEPLAGNVTRRLELGAQMLWPVCFWRPLGNEDVISLADNAGNLISSPWVKIENTKVSKVMTRVVLTSAR